MLAVLLKLCRAVTVTATPVGTSATAALQEAKGFYSIDKEGAPSTKSVTTGPKIALLPELLVAHAVASVRITLPGQVPWDPSCCHYSRYD